MTILLPEILALVREQFNALKNKDVPLEELAVTHTLSREPDKYSVLSATALVARQLAIHGKTLKQGQRARFLYTA